MDKNYIYRILSEQAAEWSNCQRFNMRRDHFEKMSYQNWATRELLKRIKGSLADPELVIYEFKIDMERMKKISPVTRMQFEYAGEIAEWMLDILEAMKKS